MTGDQQPYRSPETKDGLAEERIGNGTFDNGWQPGDPDPNTDRVYEASAEGRPGIAPAPRYIEISGVLFTEIQAVALGLVAPEEDSTVTQKSPHDIS